MPWVAKSITRTAETLLIVSVGRKKEVACNKTFKSKRICRMGNFLYHDYGGITSKFTNGLPCANFQMSASAVD